MLSPQHAPNGPPTPDFTLVTKWISRKLATVISFYIFTANIPAPKTVKVTAAAIVTCVYMVLNVIEHRILRDSEE